MGWQVIWSYIKTPCTDTSHIKTYKHKPVTNTLSTCNRMVRASKELLLYACHLDKLPQPPQRTSMVGVLGFEKEARMMSPVTSHTVQLPSGMAVKRGRREGTME